MIGINRSVWLAACALLAGGCVPSLMVAAGSCDETAPRSAVLDAAGVTEVQVRAGSGSLRVDGRPGLAEIQIDGTACAADREDLDRIELVTSRSGGTLLIEARTREVSNGQLALNIAMPDSLPLSVDDGTGSIEIVGVAAAAVRDGAGSLRVELVRGDVRVADGSGGIDIRDVRQDVLIEQDGSGSIVRRRRGLHRPARRERRRAAPQRGRAGLRATPLRPPRRPGAHDLRARLCRR